MTGCPAKPLAGAMQPRQHAGLGAGSQSAFQIAVGLVMLHVQMPDERMVSVQACCCEGCLAAGGWESRMFTDIPAGRLRLASHRNRYPFPPPPHRSVRGSV